MTQNNNQNNNNKNFEINFLEIQQWPSLSIEHYRKELDDIIISPETIQTQLTETIFALLTTTNQFFELHQNSFVKENKKELIPLITNKLLNFFYYLPTITVENGEYSEEIVSIEYEQMNNIIELAKRLYLIMITISKYSRLLHNQLTSPKFHFMKRFILTNNVFLSSIFVSIINYKTMLVNHVNMSNMMIEDIFYMNYSNTAFEQFVKQLEEKLIEKKLNIKDVNKSYEEYLKLNMKEIQIESTEKIHLLIQLRLYWILNNYERNEELWNDLFAANCIYQIAGIDNDIFLEGYLFPLTILERMFDIKQCRFFHKPIIVKVKFIDNYEYFVRNATKLFTENQLQLSLISQSLLMSSTDLSTKIDSNEDEIISIETNTSDDKPIGWRSAVSPTSV